ncbi:MAG: MBL fold metallo-hydrolase [Verrucomicrobiales bacterium]|nr:MBL fold metallo-hydrolase [Verrucomicrobiales bacterium]
MIPALQKDDELVAEFHEADAVTGVIHVWWLGQSGFLIKWNGEGLLFDPYLSDSLTRKYDGTEQPHVRMSEQAVDPLLLSGVDVVTSSHNHTDHLDAETLLPLKAANPNLKLVVPEANLEFAERRLGPAGPELVGVDVGSYVEVGGFQINAITAAHNEIEYDSEGRSKFLGYVVTCGQFAIFHSGDTLWHDSLVKEVRRWPINLALLPINGNDPARKVAGNLNGFEAAALAKAISASLVIPCHYHMFEFNTADPDEEFIGCCERLNQRYRILEIGQCMTMGPVPDSSAGDARATEKQEDDWGLGY